VVPGFSGPDEGNVHICRDQVVPSLQRSDLWREAELVEQKGRERNMKEEKLGLRRGGPKVCRIEGSERTG
jgi:hypothetical protein